MSKDMKKVTYETLEQVTTIDSTSGEVISETSMHRQTTKHSKEPNFVKLYLDHLGKFKGLQMSLSPILTNLLKHTSYAKPDEEEGGMILYLNKPLKSDIAKACGVSLTRVDHAVTEFVKKGYMRRLDLGKYQFNPFLFGIGDWNNVENIRATFDYGTGEAIAEIVRNEEIAINTATEEILKTSKKALENAG